MYILDHLAGDAFPIAGNCFPTVLKSFHLHMSVLNDRLLCSSTFGNRRREHVSKDTTANRVFESKANTTAILAHIRVYDCEVKANE